MTFHIITFMKFACINYISLLLCLHVIFLFFYIVLTHIDMNLDNMLCMLIISDTCGAWISINNFLEKNDDCTLPGWKFRHKSGYLLFSSIVFDFIGWPKVVLVQMFGSTQWKVSWVARDPYKTRHLRSRNSNQKKRGGNPLTQFYSNYNRIHEKILTFFTNISIILETLNLPRPINDQPWKYFENELRNMKYFENDHYKIKYFENDHRNMKSHVFEIHCWNWKHFNYGCL